MAVDLNGNVRMRGDTGPGVGVRVLVEGGRLRLVSGNELVGDWRLAEVGFVGLQDGFNVRAEGEEFVLRTEDDVALAEEIGIAAASPRLARRLAARHNPEERSIVSEEPLVSSNLAAIGFAIAGAMVAVGGVFLDVAGEGPAFPDPATDSWLAFVIGGALMIAAAYVMSIGLRWARMIAALVLLGMIVVFGFAVGEAAPDTTHLTAFGFIAGGVVIGVAVLASGSLRQPD